MTRKMWIQLAVLTISSTLLVAPVAARVILVPDEAPGIQAAIDGASDGDTIRVDGTQGPYTERLRIDADRLSRVTLEAERSGSPAVVVAPARSHAVLRLHNPENVPFDVAVNGLDFDGADQVSFGIWLETGPDAGDDPVNRLALDGVGVSRAQFGIQVGTRTGTDGCDGQWGAVDRFLLDQARNEFHMRNSSVVGCAYDGMNLYRVTGSVTGSFIGFNGDEGIHATEADEFMVRQNVFVRNAGTGLHFQIGGDVWVENNVLALTSTRHSGGITIGGTALSVNGTLGFGRVRVLNNLLYGNTSSGLRITPCEVVVAPDSCEARPTVADVTNNLLGRNGLGDGRLFPTSDFHYLDHGIDGMDVVVRYNAVVEGDDPSSVPLDSTNVAGIDPLFVDEPSVGGLPRVVIEPWAAWERARALVMGFAFDEASPLIDFGHPDSVHEDRGGLSRGSLRNDLGVFGGPWSEWDFGGSEPPPGTF